MIINKNTSIKELALIVSTKLGESGVDAVLVGGAVVSIYTHNEYESGDLDFVSYSSVKDIDKVMKAIGFVKQGKSYVSTSTELYIEFPSGPIAVDDELLSDFEEVRDQGMVLRLFTPTQSIMDRLAAYYFWNDIQSLDQALMIAKVQPFSIEKIKAWSKKEGELDKFNNFQKNLN